MAENDTQVAVGPTSAMEAIVSKADLAFWTMLPSWNLREQAALMLGLDPENTAELESSVEFKRRRLLMKRVRLAEHLSETPTPFAVMEWAKSNRIEVPSDLMEAVARRRRLINWRARYRRLKEKFDQVEQPEGENLPPKTRRSLEIMLLAMAIEKYGYKLGGNNSAAKQISAAATINDGKVLIGEDAVRDRLRDAAEKFGYEFEE